MSKPPTPSSLKPAKTQYPLGPPKPMPPSGSSKVVTHPSPVEKVALEGRRTKGKMAEIKRRGGK